MKVYSKLSDLSLSVLLQDGDQNAFTEIYNRYWSLIYTHVFKMLRNEADAEDTVQEVFSNLWLKADQIKPNTNISGLLYISARNRVLNLIAQNRVQNDYLSEIASFLTDAQVNPVNTIDEKAILAIVEREIRNLPPKMRQIFELSRKESLSHKEIAQQLNISDQTVKKQIQNALKIIKPKLNNAGISLLALAIVSS